MINDSLSHVRPSDNTQFVISYELLCLLRWLVEHDAEKIKKLVTKALSHGLKHEIKKIDHGGNEHNAEDIQHSIIDFFTMLETVLLESLNEYAVQKATEKNLMPTIEHIDMSICDDATVRSSLEHASTKIERSSSKDAQEVLLKELLRRWKPTKKAIVN